MTESGDYGDSIDLGLLRPGKYSRGSETVDAILKAALHVLIEEGSPSFTLRRIAAECNLQVGNVSRHFPKKEMLVQVLLFELLSECEEHLKRGIRDTKMPAEEALAFIITGTLDEIGTKRMTHLFTELWAMSNHNPVIAERVEATYRYVHTLIGTYVKKLNPSLTPRDVEAVALYINATMEGTTILAGFGKPWKKKMPMLKRLSVKWLIEMVKNITSDDIKRL